MFSYVLLLLLLSYIIVGHFIPFYFCIILIVWFYLSHYSPEMFSSRSNHVKHFVTCLKSAVYIKFYCYYCYYYYYYYSRWASSCVPPYHEVVTADTFNNLWMHTVFWSRKVEWCQLMNKTEVILLHQKQRCVKLLNKSSVRSYIV